ncbi:circularly permuted type 2 ATP-grasp protein [Ferruginivarius sediminum]|uniref:Circularly permuted type 2 ATP-grasp protein n=1 Tax=Ferruginivarius sediminum TaxID=2661937 RepID=A0A369T5S6_9PROT|nr:circularly permuted type 2 ATP-grasp protein [Ferruginivarius sediminum]RDD60670.1 circularly permuted type 2 ATP-grasp protein [Ferruginivarius sediminum]
MPQDQQQAAETLAPQPTKPAQGLLAGYEALGHYDELLALYRDTNPSARAILDRLDGMDLETLCDRARDAELELYNFGITFTVYTQKDAIDRILPFDVIPRAISAADWAVLERGVQQRVAAINAFIGDVYNDGKILKDGVVPADLVLTNENYRPEMEGLAVPHGTYAHIDGTDIVRGNDGAFYVLEDNARTPSGVSYVVENRHLMLRAFPDLMHELPVRPVSNYGQRLREALGDIAPESVLDPVVVLLSPGTYNSAYFEHIFLAREMGVPLVEGRDLLVEDDRVYMKTIRGLQRVDVIYRRINDDFLDPEAFNPASMLGVPGLMRCYRKGTVGLANAVGTGIADDKAVYAYMPRIIRYYLDEEPVIQNVETHICRETEGLRFTLDNLDKLVVKPVGEAGGYGITVGPRASRDELETCRKQLEERPANYISQPMIDLSVCPTLTDHAIAPRHVDLRPFAVTGKSTWVLPGGLTRVALREGSIIVNSSQGGGSKDTWVLE